MIYLKQYRLGMEMIFSDHCVLKVIKRAIDCCRLGSTGKIWHMHKEYFFSRKWDSFFGKFLKILVVQQYLQLHPVGTVGKCCYYFQYYDKQCIEKLTASCQNHIPWFLHTMRRISRRSLNHEESRLSIFKDILIPRKDSWLSRRFLQQLQYE